MKRYPNKRSVYQRYMKRVFDLLLSIIVLLLIWPLLIAVYITLRIKLGKPVMLKQKRPGLMGEPFNICKFRTMTDQRDVNGHLLPDEQRITPIGRLIRSLSLDELSEVFNIFKGEMSFVGPRPLMMQYLDRYTPEQARRHDVMPGLTGWVQVKGRNSLDWEEKFALDIWYVDHQSFSLDLYILFMTVWIVLRREGISQEGHVAAEEFMGSQVCRNTLDQASQTRDDHASFSKQGILGSSISSNSSSWEQGSEFHLINGFQQTQHSVHPWRDKGLLLGTGRDAIKSILVLGMASRGWKRLWVPAYFCQEVLSSIAETGIILQSYSSWYPGKSGGNEAPDLKIGDVILVVNHFGLHAEAGLGFDLSQVSAVIEDHSHDPWSAWAFNSKADYCVASLRKTLPVPDGGVLWSPKLLALPNPALLTEQHRIAAENKLEAMKKKALFLNGQIFDKSIYRKLSMAGEEDLCGRDISAILEWSKQNLDKFPAKEWREARKQNHKTLSHALSSLKRIQVVCPRMAADVVPFSCILLFDSVKRREFVRNKLIQSNIYPAILWPLQNPAVGDIPADHVEASMRMLSIHCDMRYSEQDISFVAECIKKYDSEFKD